MAAVHIAAFHLEAWPAVVGDAAVVVVTATFLEAIQDLARVAALPGCGGARQRQDVDGYVRGNCTAADAVSMMMMMMMMIMMMMMMIISIYIPD